MKKILVLGSEGFIGSYVVSYALSVGHEVYAVDMIDKRPSSYIYHRLSLLTPDIELLMSSTSFDIIINCAGSGNVGFSFQHTQTDFDLNTRSIVFILEAIRKYQIQAKYVHVSSAAVYGNPDRLPVDENFPIQPVSPYGYHKWMSEIVCREYFDLFDLNIAIARPFSVYGPGLQKQLIWDLFQKARLQDVITLWGTGEETRDFIFVEDVARALISIGELTSSDIFIYNLACGQAVTVRHVANTLMISLGWNRSILFNGEVREGDPRFWQAEISSLKSLGFKPSVSLEEGINFTAKWLLALSLEK